MENIERKRSDVVKELFRFYDANRDWIIDYNDFAKKFDDDIIERNISIIDLNNKLDSCSVLILTANPVEQNILTQKLYNEVNRNRQKKERLYEIYADGCVYQFANIDNIEIVHMHPNSTSSFTRGGSANAIRSALERFRPKLVVSLGVAFGIDPNEQKLGDVLLSSGIIPYDIFNKDKDGEITLRTIDTMRTHDALNAWNVLLRNPKFSLNENMKIRRSLIKREICFGWQFGTMLSGGSVLSNEQKKQALLVAAKKCGEKEVIGGEMEGVGIYSECEKPNIPCIVIKGICDYGAEKNSWEDAIELSNQRQHDKELFQKKDCQVTNDLLKDCVQAYAMDNATEAVFRLLRFDSNFLDAYMPLKKSNVTTNFLKRFRIKKNEEFTKKLKGRFFCLFGFYLIILPLFYLFNKSFSFECTLIRNIFIIQLIAIIGATILILFKERILFYPTKTQHEWVIFDLDSINLNKQPSYLILNDKRTIYNCVITLWKRPFNTYIDSKIIGNIKRTSTIKIDNNELYDNNSIIQIDYETSNGEHYVHLISQKYICKIINKKKVNNHYRERIFLLKNKEYKLVSTQNKLIYAYNKKSNIQPRMYKRHLKNNDSLINLKDLDISSNIINELKNDSIELVGEYLDLGLGELLEDYVIGKIPIISTCSKIYKMTKDIKTAFFYKKLIHFMFHMNNMSHEDRIKFINKHINVSQKSEKELGEQILLMIEKLDEVAKIKYYVNLIKVFTCCDIINYRDFLRICYILDNIFVADLEEFKTMSLFALKNGAIWHNGILTMALSNLGLVMWDVTQSTHFHGDDGIRITRIGELFHFVINWDENKKLE